MKNFKSLSVAFISIFIALNFIACSNNNGSKEIACSNNNGSNEVTLDPEKDAKTLVDLINDNKISEANLFESMVGSKYSEDEYTEFFLEASTYSKELGIQEKLFSFYFSE